ncbi:MAG: SpoIID/LytB domain-containing protein [Elusimicrobiota bacterium]
MFKIDIYEVKKNFLKIAIVYLILGLGAIIHAQTLNQAMEETANFNYKKALLILGQLPGKPLVQEQLAWANLRAGQYKRAIKIFSTLDQNDYQTLFGLGLGYFLNQQYDQSLLWFQQCLKINKNCAAAEYFCGEIKNIKGLSREAVKHYRHTLKLDYNFSEAILKLAQTYENLKEYDNSFREWARIAGIDPQFKGAEQRKQTLLALISKKPEDILSSKKIIQGTVVPAAANAKNIPLLRIGIAQGIDEIKLWSADGLLVSDNEKTFLQTGAGETFILNTSSEIFKNKKQIIVHTKAGNSGIVVKDVKFAPGFAWAGIADREYRGHIEVNFGPGAYLLVNIVNIEEYIYSVLPSEMISSWPREALKAQAVIARGEAMYKKDFSKPHKKDNFDLCDDQHCQVYKGIKVESSLVREVVDSTRGEVLVYQDKIIHSLYSSNCSGHTQSSKELKGWGIVPYLFGVIDGELNFPKDLTGLEHWIKYPPDIFCAPSPYTYYAESRWIRVISQDELETFLNRNYLLGGIKKIVPLKRSESGHIKLLELTGTKGIVEIEKENLIRDIAFGKLRSTNFTVEGYGMTETELPRYFIFWGAGWGHAVGLCQSGAAGMAAKGFKYDQILKKYYQNTNLKKMGY